MVISREKAKINQAKLAFKCSKAKVLELGDFILLTSFVIINILLISIT